MERNRNRHPEEMTTYEYLDEHLYQRALKGSYQKEFNEVRERVDSLKRYKNAREFMKEMWKHRNLRIRTVKELERLWKDDYDFRPTTGAILMLALWHSSMLAGENFWYRLFVRMENQPDTENIQDMAPCLPGRDSLSSRGAKRSGAENGGDLC
jgi:hypothetical protein